MEQRLPPADHLPWTCVIFDLDGTLVDSAIGVMNSVCAAFQDEGFEPPPPHLRDWVGPPMLDALRAYGLGEAAALAIHGRYRARYDTVGVLETSIFEGVVELLDSLRRMDVPLAVATSKPVGPTTLILDHLGLRSRFRAVRAAIPGDPGSTKTALVSQVVDDLGELRVDVSRAVVVGDRHHDVSAAEANGLESIFAGWGYGGAAESVRASWVVGEVSGLRALLEKATGSRSDR